MIEQQQQMTQQHQATDGSNSGAALEW